jgi:hypothetical protein
MAGAWGGRREGAGRKAAGETQRRPVTVWLSQAETDRLRELGGGNASAGVRLLLAETRNAVS